MSKRLSSPSNNEPMGKGLVVNWSMRQLIDEVLDALPSHEHMLTEHVWTADPDVAAFLKEKGFAQWRENRRRQAEDEWAYN